MAKASRLVSKQTKSILSIEDRLTAIENKLDMLLGTHNGNATQSVTVEYENMTRAQLMNLAAERGLNMSNRASKEDMVDLLKGSEPESGL